MDQIGGFQLDASKQCLISASGDQIDLRPQSFEVLQYLAKNRGRVVEKAELLHWIWKDVHVTEDSVVQCISEIRKALGGESGIELKTIIRRGYMLTASSAADAQDPSRAEIPSIAVLPFDNLAGERGAMLADGLTEDIITEISRHRDIFVIARHSILAYRESGANLNEISERLEVNYLLHGSVQIQQSTVRINVQLTDSSNQSLVWSDRYERKADSFFDLQDEISATIVNRVAGDAGIVLSQERVRVRRKPPTSLQAYDHYVAGSNVNDYFTPEGAARALDYYEKAVAKDPGFARAWTRLALVHQACAAFGFTDDLEKSAQGFIRAGLEAIRLDPNDALNQAAAGGAYSFAGEMTPAKECFERALMLGPNDADALALVSYIRPTKFPTAQQDLENVRRAISLNPFHPEWYDIARGYTAYHARNYEEVVDALVGVTSQFVDREMYLAMAYAELGDKQSVELHRARLLELLPGFSVQDIIEGDRIVDEDAAGHFRESGAKAGLPA